MKSIQLLTTGILAAISGLALIGCSGGKADERRREKQTETLDRPVAEFNATDGNWKVTAPGVTGFVYPAWIEAQAVDLILTDVLLAEHILRTQLPLLDTAQTFPAPPVHLKLHRYIRQYRGFRDNDGHLHVHINAAWDNEPGDRGWIRVKDGGNAYWQVRVDVNAGRLYSLSVNGEA